MLRTLSWPQATCKVIRAAKSAVVTALMTLQVACGHDNRGAAKPPVISISLLIYTG